jgi:hypothetical protein
VPAPERSRMGAVSASRMNGASAARVLHPFKGRLVGLNRWDEKAGLRRDAVRSQVIDALEAQEIKETRLFGIAGLHFSVLGSLAFSECVLLSSN